ncbi:MAG: DUF2147 domain-containing protein [Caulobacteraceae bacterium]|nr:DUF2147 domain-containing protein [Caulobacteraceae bacterium]
MSFAPLLAATALLAAAPVAAADVGGVWKTPIDGGLVRLGPCGGDLCGHVVSSARLRAFPDQKDIRNRDPAQRGRAIKGLLMLKVHAKGPGRWGDGWVYNPDDGGTYKATVKLAADGRLQVRGCVAEPLCRTQTWTRAE